MPTNKQTNKPATDFKNTGNKKSETFMKSFNSPIAKCCTGINKVSAHRYSIEHTTHKLVSFNIRYLYYTGVKNK